MTARDGGDVDSRQGGIASFDGTARKAASGFETVILCDVGVADASRYPGRVPVARVVIDGTDPIRMRAASALLPDHRVDRVGLLGASPAAGWGSRSVSVTSTVGWDVVVGRDPEPGQVDVTVGSGGVVWGAGPSGLARSLGAVVGGDVSLAGTVPGTRLREGPRFGFPAPLSWLHGVLEDGIHHCPVPGSLAGVLAVRDSGASLAVVDDRRFLDGCALAGGVLLAIDGHRGPVWDAAESYLERVGELGLVIADRR